MFGIGNNHPFYIVKKDNKGGALEPRHSFLSISDPLVAMSLIKKIQVSLPFEAKQVIRTNLIEDEEEVLPVKGRTISLKLGHHSIETFKLVL